MKKIFAFGLSLALLLGAGSLVGADQSTGGTVQGNIYVDSDGNGQYDDGESVPVTITLLTLKDGKWVPVEISYTVEKGHYLFDQVPYGTYRLQFVFDGGVTRTTQSFVLSDEQKDFWASFTLSRDFGEHLVIPDTYKQGRDSLAFVNIAAILGEEVSTFKP